jgi:hypothetical protein
MDSIYIHVYMGSMPDMLLANAVPAWAGEQGARDRGESKHENIDISWWAT